jgi:hypothetical protein
MRSQMAIDRVTYKGGIVKLWRIIIIKIIYAGVEFYIASIGIAWLIQEVCDQVHFLIYSLNLSVNVFTWKSEKLQNSVYVKFFLCIHVIFVCI